VSVSDPDELSHHRSGHEIIIDCNAQSRSRWHRLTVHGEPNLRSELFSGQPAMAVMQRPCMVARIRQSNETTAPTMIGELATRTWKSQRVYRRSGAAEQRRRPRTLEQEGIEAIVFRTVSDQPTLSDAILPSQSDDQNL